jgi:hypothetical protein
VDVPFDPEDRSYKTAAETQLVPRHSDFDLLNPKSQQVWQKFRINEEFDAAGDPRLLDSEGMMTTWGRQQRGHRRITEAF